MFINVQYARETIARFSTEEEIMGRAKQYAAEEGGSGGALTTYAYAYGGALHTMQSAVKLAKDAVDEVEALTAHVKALEAFIESTIAKGDEEEYNEIYNAHANR